ncbi:MAG TPA: hypothetical protein VM925_26815, partial [Labilithrix sp.]|nr:hypothetical protein [Labilithrix sp.]
MLDARTSQATELMMRFARRTGLLTFGGSSRRYLWTDAFAVCNCVGLERATGEKRYRELALRLVDRVHHELGTHRPDDRRTGWLSGLPKEEAESHPTRGGLRIGKPLPERTSYEPLDPDLEWERDGQYFHYLTKWMHALDQVARATGELTFNVWARELCVVAHRAFTQGPHDDKRMVWKTSIDLSRALVASMGQHDPLDGFVTCAELDATAIAFGNESGPSLTAESADFDRMLNRETLATDDALGIGGLLFDACRLAQLECSSRYMIASLLGAAAAGLRRYVDSPELRAPAHRRLAFRELGLATGLAGLPFLEELSPEQLGVAGIEYLRELGEYAPLRTEIESFWLRPAHRLTPSWLAHADINDVMLATSLAPE